MKKIFLALQDQITRAWLPVARVDKLPQGFVLRYTEGAFSAADFKGFGRMNKLDAAYVSHSLFPLLKNRVMSRSRPEYSTFARWLGKDAESLEAFEELAITGGQRGTDNLELIPVPEPDEAGNYKANFFVHGVRYLGPGALFHFSELEEGDELILERDRNNPSDSHALLLKKGAETTAIGYVPRYFSSEFSALLDLNSDKVKVEVLRVNGDAPLAFRVLCELSTPWPENFEACRKSVFELIADPPDAVHLVS